jgi:hypothetical protein
MTAAVETEAKRIPDYYIWDQAPNGHRILLGSVFKQSQAHGLDIVFGNSRWVAVARQDMRSIRERCPEDIADFYIFQSDGNQSFVGKAYKPKRGDGILLLVEGSWFIAIPSPLKSR